MPRDMVTRRDILKVTAGAGIVGVAGCLSDDEGTLAVGGGPSGSSTYGATQALSRAADQHSDDLAVSIQETDGNVSNVRLYNDGQIDAGAIDNGNLFDAISSEGDFDDTPADDLPLQGFNISSVEVFFVAVDGSGIESTADLAGHDVHIGQPGSAVTASAETLLEETGVLDEINRVGVDWSDLAGAIQEERVEAFATYGSGGVELTGWAQEVDAQHDVYTIETSQDVVDTMDEEPGIREIELEPYGWDQSMDDVTDEVTAWAIEAQLMLGSSVSEEIGYELARLSHEHNDTIREANEPYPDHSDPEEMTVLIDDDPLDHPVHPGVAEYLDEEGVWNDSWTIGDV